MPYYPSQRFVMSLTTVRRTRALPPEVIGDFAAKLNQDVEAQDIVLRGSIPGRFVLIDMLQPLGLKSADQLTPEMVLVDPGDVFEKGRVIAQNGEGRGAKTLKSPINAIVARVDGGQIILQANPEPVEVYAMCPGEVTTVHGKSDVVIETYGALIQGAWGNGQRTFTPYRLEPEGGLETLRGTGMITDYRNSAIIMTKPILTPDLFLIAATQELTGLIAPSMHADLREMALRQRIPIVLTEGFGELQMSELVYNLLRDYVGRPAFLDAVEPQRWSTVRPEIIIPLPTGGTIPPTPDTNQALVEGAFVRLTRAPYLGMSGRVRRITEAPRAVENGLHLPGADVLLSSGQTVFVPLANLELLGRTVDQS